MARLIIVIHATTRINSRIRKLVIPGIRRKGRKSARKQAAGTFFQHYPNMVVLSYVSDSGRSESRIEDCSERFIIETGRR